MSENLSAIAFVWQSKSLTGAQQRFLSIAQALNAKGIPTIVLLEEPDVHSLEQIAGAPVPNVLTYRLPLWLRMLRRGHHRWRRTWSALGMRSLFILGARPFWNALIKRHQIGLCHVSMSTTLAHIVTGPAIFEVTSPDWAEELISSPDSVPPHIILHAVSENVGELLRKGLPDRNVIQAPIPFPNLDPESSLAPSMNTKENLIVFGHRLIPRKNGLLFARVANRFLDDHPDWRIAIRGKGPEEDKIRKLLRQHINNGRVLLGYQPDLPAELRKAKIFVSIITPDNYPSQSVIEAMVCGNALLLSNTGRTREKFFDDNGRMTELDEDRILSGLEALTECPEELNRMGTASYALASRRFSQDAYLEHLIALYSKAKSMG